MFRKYFILSTVFVLIITSGCSPASPPTPSTPTPPKETQPIPESPPDTFMLEIGEATKETIRYHDTDTITVLVNKQNSLPIDYIPPDLVDVDIPFTFKEKAEKRQLRQEAATELAKLFATAKNENIILYGVSGYRSYQTQKGLFAYFTQRYGSEEKANQISARPGESEHQTGLAMDVTSQSVNYGLEQSFGETKEYAWLAENAHLFGYVVRYPKGKEHITEYTYEPWHLRYIGTELATKLYEEKITYEEYLFFRI